MVAKKYLLMIGLLMAVSFVIVQAFPGTGVEMHTLQQIVRGAGANPTYSVDQNGGGNGFVDRADRATIANSAEAVSCADCITGDHIDEATLVGVGGGVWSENGNRIYYNNGNVGISNSNPQAQLHVGSNSLSNPSIRIQGSGDSEWWSGRIHWTEPGADGQACDAYYEDGVLHCAQTTTVSQHQQGWTLGPKGTLIADWGENSVNNFMLQMASDCAGDGGIDCQRDWSWTEDGWYVTPSLHVVGTNEANNLVVDGNSAILGTLSVAGGISSLDLRPLVLSPSGTSSYTPGPREICVLTVDYPGGSASGSCDGRDSETCSLQPNNNNGARYICLIR